ncbi:hypothetical protein GCM10010495_59610 [Kitasatospora herbaricolor]|uniref:hypothetical protein n=1 Tax=Kitasatospora herbaricolor TaxID=68217 RepID=UPI00174C999F|nr:hypothetical protein [Kitasatospora herbaricolor]MDQ0306539.1 UPF0716 family protein affecting phage T7 exclusion [Kitasatospora herbaricolor]GGV34678.1 hypothetical protein GCM10010495_59610 [Kitasatospora herbaricolor]
MALHWSALGEVAAVSIGSTVAIAVVFTLGVRSMLNRQEARESGRSSAAALAGAAVCFLACGGAVLYGLYLIIPQFHG